MPFHREPPRQPLTQRAGGPRDAAGYVEDLVALAAVEVVVVVLLELEPGASVEVGDAFDPPLALEALERAVHGRLTERRTRGLGPLQDLLGEEGAARGLERVPDGSLLVGRS